MTRILSLFLLGAFLIAPALHAQDTEAPAAEANGGIVSVLQAEGTFTVLLSALESAGLTEALETGGPYTLFAPTDEAFAALPEGTLDVLTPEQLTEVLGYHLLAEPVMAADAAALTEAASAQGTALSLRAEAGTLYINDATVLHPDLQAANGVIHVIDTVLLPFDGADETEGMDGEMGDDEMTPDDENL